MFKKVNIVFRPWQCGKSWSELREEKMLQLTADLEVLKQEQRFPKELVTTIQGMIEPDRSKRLKAEEALAQIQNVLDAQKDAGSFSVALGLVNNEAGGKIASTNNRKSDFKVFDLTTMKHISECIGVPLVKNKN